MEQFYPFFIVIFVAVFFSTVFKRLHVPWVVALIVGGMLISPHALNIFQPNDTLDFIAQIGLVFLMFMAGLETRLSTFKETEKEILVISLFNGLVPFFVGVGIGFLFGYGWLASLFLGIIFISSSIAVIIPSLEAHGLLHKKLGKSIVAATIIEDIASLVILSVLLQTINPGTILPLPVFYILLFMSLFALRWVLPKIKWFFDTGKYSEKDLFRQGLRSIFVILIGTVIIFEVLGLHPIIAGFFAGLVLSGSITSKTMKERLHTISYGLFIPTFFVVLGTKTDVTIFAHASEVMVLTVVVVLGSIISKFVGGWIGGRAVGFSSNESMLLGASTIPQLSTTLAVVFAVVELGLLPTELISAMVMLSIITVLISPIAVAYFKRKVTPK